MVSTSSTYSTSSCGEPFDVNSLDTTYSICDGVDEVYSEVLKVVVFEYINEPRFRRKWKRINVSTSNSDSQKLRAKSGNREVSNNRLSTWLSHGDSDDEENDPSGYNKESMKQMLKGLESKLTRVAMNQDVISDAMLRRSLLKFYNDVFLDSQFKQTLETMSKPEDLIILFVKSANKELVKMETEDPKSNLFSQMGRFINILIEVSRDTKMGPTYAKRLNDYKKSLKNTGVSSNNNVSVPNLPVGTTENVTASKLVDDTLQPTFRLDEITHVKALANIFKVDELRLQRDVIRISPIVKNDLYLQELIEVERGIRNDESSLQPSDFPDSSQYEMWKQAQLKNIQDVRNKVKQGCAGHNESGARTKLTDDTRLIPADPRRILRSLMYYIFENDFSLQSSEQNKSISLDSKFFLSKCAKYWLLSYQSGIFTNAVSGCLHIVPDLEFAESLKMIQYVFNFMETRLSNENEQELDPMLWNRYDQDQWTCNQVAIFTWLINQMDKSIKGMFNNKANGDFNLKSIISTYSALVENDSVLISRNFQKSEIYKRQIHSLKKTTFRTIEKRYIELIRNVPTNNEISIRHLYDLADAILNDVAMIEMKYKPLKKLSARYKFVHIVTNTFVTALFRDLKVLMQRIKKYNKPNESDALDTYKLLNELRYKNSIESGSDSNVGNALEVEFYEYLLTFCEHISETMKQGCERIVSQEEWVPMDKEAEQWLSQSAYDIARLISDTLRLVDNLQWNDFAQLARAYNIILGKVSECIVHYTKTMEEIVTEDLSMGSGIDGNGELNSGNMSLFKEMKSMIQSSKLWNKQWKHDVQKEETPTSGRSSSATTGNGSSGTYVISMRSCVCLNNMESLIVMLNDIEKTFHMKQLSNALRADVAAKATNGSSSSVNERRTNKQLLSLIKGQLWSIVPVAAEGVPQVESGQEDPWYSISIVDTAKRREIYRTRAAGSPRWWEDEEFDLELEPQQKMSLCLVLWQDKQDKKNRMRMSGTHSHDHDNGKKKNTETPVGRCYLDLDIPRDMYGTNANSNNNNSEREMYLSLSLDTQGYIHVKVSIEVERAEPDCIIGRTRRIVARTLTRGLKQVSHRFEPCIHRSFSKETLSALMNHVNGRSRRPEDDAIYDSLVPLFDDLNENLTVLAQALPTSLLHEVMLLVWHEIIVAADDLLLPQLQQALQHASMSAASNAHKNNNNNLTVPGSVWDSAISGFQKVLQTKPLSPNASGGSNTSINMNNRSHNAISQLEVEIVLMWMDILSKDFFHNNGEGPPLAELKNDAYQNLMLIASMFDQPTPDLKATVLQTKDQSASSSSASAYSLRLPLQMAIALRILWSRGEYHFVSKFLESRAREIRAAVAMSKITLNDKK